MKVADRLKVLERENRELRQAHEILRKASAHGDKLAFCPVITVLLKLTDHIPA